MKKLLLGLIVAILVFAVLAGSVNAATRVKGYTTKRRSYVAPHYRSSPNRTKFDNYSTRGNINPYTGKKGTVNPFKLNTRKYK